MDKALEAGLKVYPPKYEGTRPTMFGDIPNDANELRRAFYIATYKDVQKDILCDIEEWLKNNVQNYVNREYNEFHHEVEYDGTVNTDKLIEDLKKAMEG